jgi:hypothetical protein
MSYRVTLDVDRELVWYLARLLRAERRRLGTRRGTRCLTPFQQALFGLAWMRDRCEVERLGAGFGLSRATAYRYRDEVLDVLSNQAPDLQEALERAKQAGVAYLILDGGLTGRGCWDWWELAVGWLVRARWSRLGGGFRDRHSPQRLSC